MTRLLARIFGRGPGIFRLGAFRLHSGGASSFKIDCDALADADLDALAAEAYARLPAFGHVVGVPRGGLRLAAALRRYEVAACDRVLVADDVLTTGRSVLEARAAVLADATRHGFPGVPVSGVVIFARGPVPPWVLPLFTMAEFPWEGGR